MRPWIMKLAGTGCLLLPVLAWCAEAAPPRRFAAPDAAASLPHTGIGGIGQVTVALLVVLALVFALAFLLKKMRAATGAGPDGIEVLAQASLGAKERAVVIRVDGARLLLGVAQGQVSLLQVLSSSAPTAPATPPAPPAPEKPNFAQLLRRSLGR
ncbi:MAG TPA: flagellar biosynthetic protein FliO [Steroidobacteraceae bacterium]|nr:flagellar biosynthetic protein FliO [Steroidobacteraceae bacterium]